MKTAETPITKTMLRMPTDLAKWLKHQAVDNLRSMNSEIVARLQESREKAEQAQK